MSSLTQKLFRFESHSRHGYLYFVLLFYVGKPEGKRPLGRPRRRWVDNIKMDLRETGCDRDWWRAYLNAVMNLRVLE
jgi:hypothetical protein